MVTTERINPETRIPERECEDCGKWLPLYEFPTSHRTWICKVCQGMKKPTRQKLAPGVYAEYLEALRQIDLERAKLRLAYEDQRRELEKKRADIVTDYYAKVAP